MKYSSNHEHKNKEITKRMIETKGLMIHTDLGSQYTSEEFTKHVLSKGMKQSFSHKGCPYDNACIESFHAILKKRRNSPC